MFAHCFISIRKYLLLVISIILCLGFFALETQAATGTVTGSVLNIRDGPGTHYAKKGSLVKGAQVSIVGQNGSWLSVRLNSGTTGWVHSNYVKTSTVTGNTALVNPNPSVSQANTGTVIGSVVNVREGAGTQYAKKTSVTKGAKVSVIGQKPSWLNIRLTNGVTGWIHTDYVKIASVTPAPSTGSNTGSKIEVTGSIVNLRQGPGTSYNAQGQVKKGDQLLLLGQREGWYQVQTSRGAAYLAGWFARVLTPEVASAEEVTTPPKPPSNSEEDEPGSNSGTGPDGYKVAEPETPGLPTGGSTTTPSVTRVVLDPGHGGYASGAIGYSGSYEKDVNLVLARKTAELLRSAGFEVLMTRDEDKNVVLTDRVEFANSAQAAIFVSIHCNGSTNPDTNGTEVYYYVDQSDPVAVAQAGERARLARIMQDSLLRELGRKDGGVRQNTYVVVRYTQIPAILIETAYLSNLGEEVLLNDPSFQDQAAKAISNGIIEYLNSVNV